MLPPYLTDAEIAEVCAPLRQGAAQVRRLRSWGIRVEVKPNGRPLVWRVDVERHGAAAPAGGDAKVRASNEPNWSRRA